VSLENYRISLDVTIAANGEF